MDNASKYVAAGNDVCFLMEERESIPIPSVNLNLGVLHFRRMQKCYVAAID